MAGHSKWANIKHRKSKQDAKRGKLFTRLIRDITVAAKQGEDSARLRTAVSKALAANMTRDTIDKAIARGAGNQDDDQHQELTYEAYLPGGVAVIVEVLTDNRNRSASEVRHVFTKHGGQLATAGSVKHSFEHKGVIVCQADVSEDDLMEALIDFDIEAIMPQEGNEWLIEVGVSDFHKTSDAIVANDWTITHSELEWFPLSTVVPADMEKTEKALEKLEELLDVQHVFHNVTMQ